MLMVLVCIYYIGQFLPPFFIGWMIIIGRSLVRDRLKWLGHHNLLVCYPLSISRF